MIDLVLWSFVLALTPWPWACRGSWLPKWLAGSATCFFGPPKAPGVGSIKTRRTLTSLGVGSRSVAEHCVQLPEESWHPAAGDTREARQGADLTRANAFRHNK